MAKYGLFDLLSHGEHRIEGSHRLLEDHRHAPAAHPTHLPFRQGREILTRAFKRRGKSFSDETINAGLSRMSQNTAAEVMTAVGRGELASDEVIRAVFPGEAPAEPTKRRREMKRSEEGWFGLGKVMGLKFR